MRKIPRTKAPKPAETATITIDIGPGADLVQATCTPNAEKETAELLDRLQYEVGSTVEWHAEGDDAEAARCELIRLTAAAHKAGRS